MSRRSRTSRNLASRPRQIIEIILALTLLVFGINLAGPWWVASSISPLAAVGYWLVSPGGRLAVGILYIVPAVLTLFGIKKELARRVGVFGMFIAFIFSALLRVLTFGFLPLIWVYPVALALITGVMYLHESRGVDEDASD